MYSSNNTHCQQCGAANPAHYEGYTECCNERVVDNGRCDNTCCHGKLVVAKAAPVTGKIREVPVTLPGGRRSRKYVVELSTYEVTASSSSGTRPRVR